ncbi:amidase [Evansella sp. AB-rgal1]|uniref:amidase n=1 Tax=Evansella sp. AB-rgal1 TaxID=3242696 RepID=UPI00359E4430
MNNSGAFMNETIQLDATDEGLLSGLTFTVKDVFDIKGHVSSAGNPDWLRTHGPAGKNALVIDKLLENGAKLNGTTITDELMYSLNGENVHYGTPVNPRDSRRIPGGSSSGSAVAVAAELVDFSLGTDTGGSVRIPAAYCGVYGFRPTHGRVSMDGVIPLADSFDTVGWMARDCTTLYKVGCVLLGEVSPVGSPSFKRMLFSKDAWELVDDESFKALSPFVSLLENVINHNEWVTVSEEGLGEWSNLFRAIQGVEIWNKHGTWIKKTKPVFGPDIDARFTWASTLVKDEDKLVKRKDIRHYMEKLLGEDGLLIIPTVPGIAPLCNLSGEKIEKRRSQTMQLSCIAGLSGFPQVTVPVGGVSGIPLGLSVIAGRNQDIRLLQWVNKLKLDE